MTAQPNQYVESMIRTVFWCEGIGVQLAPWEFLAPEEEASAAEEMNALEYYEYAKKRIREGNPGENHVHCMRETWDQFTEEIFAGKHVFLAYFKQNGKFYSSGNYRTELTDLQEIWNDVQARQRGNGLPGLNGGKSFNILVEIPGIKHEHPRMIMALEKDT